MQADTVEIPPCKICVVETIDDIDQLPKYVIARFHYPSDAVQYAATLNKLTEGSPRYKVYIMSSDGKSLVAWENDLRDLSVVDFPIQQAN